MDTNFYSVIGCNIKSSKDEINQGYKNKIKKFINLDEYDQNTKNEIKILKTAKYILLDDNLRSKYDSMIKNNYLEDQNDLRINTDINNTAPRRDFRLDNENSDKLSNRIFERFNFD